VEDLDYRYERVTERYEEALPTALLWGGWMERLQVRMKFFCLLYSFSAVSPVYELHAFIQYNPMFMTVYTMC
jgi:hypothetical protein